MAHEHGSKSLQLTCPNTLVSGTFDSYRTKGNQKLRHLPHTLVRTAGSQAAAEWGLHRL